MMVSNVFLALPVIFAGIYYEWLYLFFAGGVFIFSPLYHWYRIRNRRSPYYFVFERLDWYFALGAFAYMYYYVAHYNLAQHKFMLFVLLTAAILFYLYGRLINYKKFHPWFHIVAPIISSAILVLAHKS